MLVKMINVSWLAALLAVAIVPTMEARLVSVKLNFEMTVAEDRHHLSEEMIHLCAEETDVSMADLEKFRQHDFNHTSETIQCFAHCVYEHMGLMRNGVFMERDAFDTLSEMTDPKSFIFKDCAEIKGVNKCETAFKIYKCRHGVRMDLLNKKDNSAEADKSTPLPATEA